MCERFALMYVSLPCVCREHAGAEEGVTAPGTGVTENDHWCMCLRIEPESSEDQPGLLTTEATF